jgi:predicted O-methyltransferase YrrM
MAPLRLSMDSQRRILDEWIRPFEPEYRGNTTYRDGVNNYAGPGFGFIEAQALHAFIRKTRPRRVIEVGSGVSTWCMLAALKMNAAEDGAPFALSCIDPNPSAFLRSLPVHLQKSKVEDVDLSFFNQLEKGDFLQIDSSHAVRCCGDVAKIYTEIAPRLRPGVFVHIHDVTFPYMFPRDVEETYTQAMETVVLFTLLADSPRYETLLCLSYLHHKDPAALKAAFPEYDPQPNIGGLPGSDVKRFGEKRHFPSSIYIVVKKPALN